MTAAAFRRRITALGISQRGFARRVGVNERTVRRWIAGQQDIPQWVGLVLDLAEGGAERHRVEPTNAR